jgi:hypothetical protein
MADTSITAKFGLDAGPFNRGLSDVRQRLANVDQQAKDLNRNLGKLRTMMGMFAVAAIGIKMVGGFFKTAIDRANEMEGSLNKNAEAVRNFSQANEKLKKDLSELGATIAVNVVGSLNRVGEKMGDIIRIGVNLGKGISIDQTIADIEAGVKAREGELEGAEKLKAAEQRRADRIKQNASELANLQRANQSAQAETNRLIEQEAKLRDAAFLAGLSQEDLATELEVRLKATQEPDLLDTINNLPEDVEMLFRTVGVDKAMENIKGLQSLANRDLEIQLKALGVGDVAAAAASIAGLSGIDLEVQLKALGVGDVTAAAASIIELRNVTNEPLQAHLEVLGIQDLDQLIAGLNSVEAQKVIQASVELNESSLSDLAAISDEVGILQAKIKALEVEDNDRGEDDRGQRLNELESARIRLAEIQAAQASKRLQQAELEIQLARVKAGIEEEAAKNQAKTDAENDKRRNQKRQEIELLRQELTLAQEGVEKTKENEAQARRNRVAPSIEEAAESGTGQIKRLAQSALRDEERAKEAALRGNKAESERLGERALETRAKLSGIIQDSDSNPMKSVEENTKKSVEALQEILLQLTNAEADNSDE